MMMKKIGILNDRRFFSLFLSGIFSGPGRKMIGMRERKKRKKKKLLKRRRKRKKRIRKKKVKAKRKKEKKKKRRNLTQKAAQKKIKKILILHSKVEGRLPAKRTANYILNVKQVIQKTYLNQ